MTVLLFCHAKCHQDINCGSAERFATLHFLYFFTVHLQLLMCLLVQFYQPNDSFGSMYHFSMPTFHARLIIINLLISLFFHCSFSCAIHFCHVVCVCLFFIFVYSLHRLLLWVSSLILITVLLQASIHLVKWHWLFAVRVCCLCVASLLIQINLYVAFFRSNSPWQLILQWTRCDRLIIQFDTEKNSAEVIVGSGIHKVDVFILSFIVYFKLGNHRLISHTLYFPKRWKKNEHWAPVMKHLGDYFLCHLLALHHFSLK